MSDVLTLDMIKAARKSLEDGESMTCSGLVFYARGRFWTQEEIVALAIQEKWFSRPLPESAISIL